MDPFHVHNQQGNRAGRYVRQPQGFRAFIPSPLPPDPPIAIEGALRTLLSQADLATEPG
jgi:hypothetical protein